ncbi:MAG: hypothetical protein M3548_09050 [Actinomycetota bacterium]|nr:hypothetical protein [Actinomycetota bacterium]
MDTGTGSVTGKIAIWLVTSAVGGYLLTLPLLFAFLLVRGLFGVSAVDGDETGPVVVVTLVVGIPLVAIVLGVARAISRRLALDGARLAGFWTATVILVVAPVTVFLAARLTVNQFLGKGWLW